MKHAQSIELRQNPTVCTQPSAPLPPSLLNPEDPFIHKVLEELRADTDELAYEKEELVTDLESARRRVALLEKISFCRRLQNAA